MASKLDFSFELCEAESLMILELQKHLMTLSPGLFPLLTFPLSLAQSWHCTVMCGPGYAMKSPFERKAFLRGRLLSYTLAGLVFGALGKTLRQSLEAQAVGFLAFLVFVFFTVSLALTWAGASSFWKPLSLFLQRTFGKIRTSSSWLQGFLSVFLPCHVLYQIFALAALSNSMVGGFLIGLAHAVVTTPALWAGAAGFQRLQKKFHQHVKWVHGLLLIMAFLNLLYFAGVWFHTEEVAQTKVLFCF